MEAKSRGWWSYTDLISLWDVVDTRKTWITTGKQMTKVQVLMLHVIKLLFNLDNWWQLSCVSCYFYCSSFYFTNNKHVFI